MNTRLFFNSESIDADDGYFLRLALSNSGYLDLLSAVPPAADVIGTISSIYAELQEPLKSICDLLLFGKTVRMEKLPETLVESMLKIRESGLIVLRENAVSLNNLYLQLVNGLLYFSELPHGRQTIYYGTDSYALACRLGTAPSRNNVLDYCAGPGIQGLLSASRGAHVTAVEVNPLASELSLCNARLNKLDTLFNVINKSIIESETDLKNLRFDFICANPPLLPFPFNLNYPFVGDGGTDGLSVIRQIMNYGIPHLSNNGKIVTLGLSGGSEVGPDIYCLAEQLQMKYQMKFILTILSRVEITPRSLWIQYMADTINMYSLGENTVSCNEVFESYQNEDISFVYSYTLSAINNKCYGRDFTVIECDNKSQPLTQWWIS